MPLLSSLSFIYGCQQIGALSCAPIHRIGIMNITIWVDQPQNIQQILKRNAHCQ